MEGETDLAFSARWDSGAETLASSLGAFGAVPKARSRSSVGNSRLVGIVDRLFKFNPGLTHCMLLGGPFIGIRGGGKPGRSEGGYIGGRAAIEFPLSAFGPVGMFAGSVFGDVLVSIVDAPLPLPLRGPIAGCSALGDGSRGLVV